MTDRLMTPVEVANDLNVTPAAVKDWRRRGVGPSWLRVGTLVRYRRADVDRWLEQQREAVGRVS